MSTLTITRAEEAYQALREVIARQELPPGTWLRQRTIAAKLGMSPTPLVQAFQRLEHEGLVECVPQWGVRVRALSVHQLDQVYRMRVALESIVFRQLATRANELRTSLEKLRPLAEEVDRAAEAVRQAVARGEQPAGTSLPVDQQFHLELARLSGMEMVVREIDRLCLLSTTIIAFVPNEKRPTITHVDLLDAILTGDPDLAERTIRSSTEANMRHTLPMLTERFGDGPIILANESFEDEE